MSDLKALLQEAQSATTAPERLRELAAKENPADVRRACAANPMTPLDILFDFIWDDINSELADIAFSNPNMPLEKEWVFLDDDDEVLLLESDVTETLIREIYQRKGCAYILAGSELCPIDILEAIADNISSIKDKIKQAYVIFALGQNPACSQRILEKIYSLGEGYAIEALARNPACSESMLERIYSLGIEENNDEYLCLLTLNPSCSRELIDKLVKNEKSCLWLACNENCPPDILSDLSRYGWDYGTEVYDLHDLLEDVARNPSTPSDALLHLALQNIKEWGKKISELAFRHPNMPLKRELANWDQEGVWLPGVWRLSQDVPQELLRKTWENIPNFRVAVAASECCPDDWLPKLAADKDDSLRRAVASNPKCSLDLLIKLADDENEYVRAAVAFNPKCPLDLLIKLTDEEDVYFPAAPAAVALNPSCPLDLLKKLADNKHAGVRAAVAFNPKCSPELLAKLTEDKDVYRFWINECVVRHPLAPLEVLYSLAATDPSEFLKNPTIQLQLLDVESLLEGLPKKAYRALASCSECPPFLLDKLASIGSSDVIASVIENNQTSFKTARELVEDWTDWEIVEAFAEKIESSKDISQDELWMYALCECADDDTISIYEIWSNAAFENPRITLKREWIDFDNGYDRLKLSDDVPVEILELLAQRETRCQEAVAVTRSCPARILENLSRSSNEIVRAAVASNPNCPSEIRDKLAKDEDTYVRDMAIVHNPHCSPEVLAKLVQNQYANVRQVIAKHSNCPIEILTKLADDKNWEIRQAVAENLNCPSEILEKLATDKDCDVRKAVTQNPKYSPKPLVKSSEIEDIDLHDLDDNDLIDFRDYYEIDPSL